MASNLACAPSCTSFMAYTAMSRPTSEFSAYQEILGDMHNLFGDTNAVHIDVYKDRYEIDQIIDGHRNGPPSLPRSLRRQCVRRRSPASAGAVSSTGRFPALTAPSPRPAAPDYPGGGPRVSEQLPFGPVRLHISGEGLMPRYFMHLAYRGAPFIAEILVGNHLRHLAQLLRRMLHGRCYLRHCRSLSAHHSVLVFEALESTSLPSWNDREEVPDGDHELARELYGIWDKLDEQNLCPVRRLYPRSLY